MAKDLIRTRRYVQKFYQMRTQLQAVGLRIQTLRSNQQMADAMRGATRVRPFLSLLRLNPPLNPLSLAPTSANADDWNVTSLCRTGDEKHEPGPQPPTDPTDHE
jgi:hypothetical protein